MANKTALQQFIKWGDMMLKSNPHKVLTFADAIDMADEFLSVEKEQINNAYFEGGFDFNFKRFKGMYEYYEEMYGK